MLKNKPEYKVIEFYYGDSMAIRSKVPLINHINEGLIILDHIKAYEISKLAFCLHPLFQMDSIIKKYGDAFINTHGFTRSVYFAMEYRGIANSYLSQHIMPDNGIRLSPYKEVNDMLIADKIQNRKDFDLYHKNSHPKTERLTKYFNEWLLALGITEDQYQEIIKLL